MTALSTVDPTAVTETLDSLSPERLEKAREVYRLSLAGETQEAIAELLSISRSTVCRLLDDYRAEYRKQLEVTPQLHLIAAKLSQYEAIANAALRDAEKATSDRGRKGHRETALKAMKAFDSLVLETGIFSREPTKLYQVTQQLKPAEREIEEGATRPREEILKSIHKLLTHGRAME